jgi:hypothetical protein
MSDRHILEGVVVLHRTIHELHSKKLDGVIFKIYFEKVYDKVKWPFLQQVLRMKGFDNIWCDRIRSFVEKEVWELRLMMILVIIFRLIRD